MLIDNEFVHVLVTLSLKGVPLEGNAKLLVRVQEHNRDLINRAAKAVEMSQAKFIRAVLVSAAKKVLEKAEQED